MLRAARPADRPALIDLALAEDAAWSGARAVSRDEADELVGSCDLGVVFERDGRAVGYAATDNGGAPLLLLPPGDHAAEALESLVEWLDARSNGEVPAYARDAERIAWLDASGRVFERSVYDLVRPAEPAPASAVWPAEVQVERFHPGVHDESVHALVYVDAGWTDVPGHTHRPLDAWLEAINPAFAWLAFRDGRPIGWISGRLFDDGRGWIEQIAVARPAHGIGVGRALLLRPDGQGLVQEALGAQVPVRADQERADALGLLGELQRRGLGVAAAPLL
jgi:hypothetical protein